MKKTTIVFHNNVFTLPGTRLKNDYYSDIKRSFTWGKIKDLFPKFPAMSRIKEGDKFIVSISRTKQSGFKRFKITLIQNGWWTETTNYNKDLPCKNYLEKLAGFKIKKGDVIWANIERKK